MTKQQEHIDNKQRRRWPWYLLLGFVLVLAVTRISLNTNFVRNIIKNQVLSAANNQLTVNLAIDKLNGDLWNEVILQGVSITNTASDTLAGIDSLRATYKPLSYFSSVFQIYQIAISEPFLKVRQKDSTLNVATWVQESPADTTSSSGSFPLQIDDFSISNGKVDAMIGALPKDSAFVVENISLNSSFAILEEGYEANISGFSFDILQTRLNEAISFETSLKAEKQTISLEKLIIATGNSVLQSSGRVDAKDSTATIDFQAQPLAWRDIAAYVDQSPVEQNIELNLQLRGSLSDLNVGLNVEATGIENLRIGTGLTFDSTFSVTRVELSADRLDLAGFLGNTALPRLQNIQMKANGNVPVQSYKEGSLEGIFSTGEIRYGSYSLDMLNSTFSLMNGNARADLNAAQQQQKIQAELEADNIWSEQPEILLTANGEQINPGYWLNDEQYRGDLAFSAEAKGKGFSPGESPWNYSLVFDDGEFANQDFTKLSLGGTVSNSKITNETLFRLQESEITFNGRVENYQEMPKFNYELQTDKFDLSEFGDMEEFTSALSLSIEGEGSGSSLETLQLQSSIQMDSSVVSGEYIDSLAAYFTVEDTIATVSRAGIKSTIADGSFNASLNLKRWYAPENELNLDLEIKDIEFLAPVADVEQISAEGTITGNLKPVNQEQLKFTGDIDFKNLRYNELFSAQKASGNVEFFVVKQPEFVVDLSLESPVISSVQLRDLSIRTNGKQAKEQIEGEFNLNFKGANESEVVHEGRYHFAGDSSVITTESFKLITSLRTLELQNPFNVILKGQSVRMDTMRLASADNEAVLELAIPYADSVRQQGYMVGKDLDMAAIQNTVLSESYFDGILSANLNVSNSDTAFNASGDVLLSELNYEGTSLDSLKLELDAGNNQLKGSLAVTHRGNRLMEGSIDLPFKLGDPQQFDDTFFDRPVQGSLKIKPVALSHFETLLNRMEIEKTEGILQLNADLSGSAGEPKFTGDLRLDSARISGVRIDSLTAGLRYVHESSKLSLQAAVSSLKQRAAEVKAEIPFYMDLKNGEVSLPGKEDSVNVDIETNNFNLAALNDFVDREQVRNMKGRINGMVHVGGTVGELETKGQLNLSKGSVRVVQTGITVDGMSASLVFKPDLLTIQSFKANSGSGSLNVNGNIGFEELIPGDMDITAKASNFKVANNSQYNAVIDLDTEINGSFTKPDISGSLSILNGFVELDNFGEESVEDVQLDSSAQSDSSVAVYDSLSLDMDVSFNRRFFIRNQRYLEMQIELDGSVDMLKDAGKDLQMFGSLETVDGYVRPLGKRFELEEGVVTFSGNPENPDLNIRTLFEPQQTEEDIKIWYIIEGNVEDPQFKYESSPPMELDDILCYTLFGQPCYALESWKRVVASSGSNSSATDLALDVFMDRIESLATQELGIDVVRIENTRVGGETGTSITTGWYINPKVFFAIQNVITGSTPDTGFLLEYMLQENLKLIISQGNDSRQGVDLKWNYDY